MAEPMTLESGSGTVRLIYFGILCRMDELTERLRQRETPVVARIAHERLLLCLRTLRPEEYDELVRAVAESDR